MERKRREAIGLDVLNDTGVHGTFEPVVLVFAGSFTRAVGGAELLLHGLVDRGQEDDLAVGSLGHGLHCLEIADLHGRGGREDVGGLSTLAWIYRI